MDKVKILDKACDLYDRSFEREAFTKGAEWMQNQYCLSYCKDCPLYSKTCDGLDFEDCEDVKCYRDNI